MAPAKAKAPAARPAGKPELSVFEHVEVITAKGVTLDVDGLSQTGAVIHALQLGYRPTGPATVDRVEEHPDADTVSVVWHVPVTSAVAV